MAHFPVCIRPWMQPNNLKMPCFVFVYVGTQLKRSTNKINVYSGLERDSVSKQSEE